MFVKTQELILLANSVPRKHQRVLYSKVRCCTRDEGRSLEAAMQVEASNHLKLRWLRARVVSVKEKASHDEVRYDQGGERKRTTDEVSKR
jgi:hypothetical protein